MSFIVRVSPTGERVVSRNESTVIRSGSGLGAHASVAGAENIQRRIKEVANRLTEAQKRINEAASRGDVGPKSSTGHDQEQVRKLSRELETLNESFDYAMNRADVMASEQEHAPRAFESTAPQRIRITSAPPKSQP
jgi:hypothetical protein